MTAPAEFYAVDGEACRDYGDDYVLLCRSDGTKKEDLARGGLGSFDCFEFLLDCPKPGIQVCFGLNYDVNNWLRDLPRQALKSLWDTHVCYWLNYRLEWIPGRWFAVRHLDGRKARVNEAFGFFQSSFVKALEAWGIGAPAEIEQMKASRQQFYRKAIAEITHYCFRECELLVELMNQLKTACKEADIVPRQWIGSGAIATALLGRQGMDQHHAYDLDIASEEVAEGVILGAYFGGRVELLRQGVFPRITTVDIRSAYPAAALALPSLDGAKLVHRKLFQAPPVQGIWHCRWDMRDAPERLLMPFPVRNKYSIYYPKMGSGWYHGVEVAAALEAGYPIEVTEGWLLRSKGIAPFDWIETVFRERQRLKRAGHAAEKVVKLGLNSVYGKLAQGYGYNSRPRWQSYFWAGYLTAATRARVLDAAARSSGVVMIATDGIFCSRPPPGLATANRLGNWETGKLDRLFAAQPGVYQGITPGREVLKSRGFFAAEVDYDELREGYEIEGPHYVHHYESTRFIGLGVALHRKDFSVWRRWKTERRSLLLSPERKQLAHGGELRPFEGPLDSDPYKPKQALIDGRALDQLQGMDQPMREVI